MLVLAAINALGVGLFVGAYGAAALRWLSQGAFLASLVLAFGVTVALWVRIERRGSLTRSPLERTGRAALALVGRIMVLLITALALVALANLSGATYLVLSALAARLRGRSGPPTV